MAATDHFIKIGIQYSQIEEFLQEKLSHAGFGGIQIHKTPMGHRIEIQAERLGMVIGRRGKHIHELTEELKDRFGLDNPELDVKNVSVNHFPTHAQKVQGSDHLEDQND